MASAVVTPRRPRPATQCESGRILPPLLNPSANKVGLFFGYYEAGISLVMPFGSSSSV